MDAKEPGKKEEPSKKEEKKPAQFGKIGFFGVVAIVAIAVVVVGVGIYVVTNHSQSSDTTNAPPVEEPAPTVLTIHLGSQSYDYTVKDLAALASITDQGGSINDAGTTTGPDTYTGVPISVLLSTIPALPGNYTLRAISSDGVTHDYLLDTVRGNVIVFDSAGNEIGPGTFTMIVAYKENGVYFNATSSGSLQIAFVYPAPVFTDSALWLNSLTDIEIL
jgi:hypothetical protein